MGPWSEKAVISVPLPVRKRKKKNNRNDFRNQINIVKSKPFCALNFNRLIGLLPPSFRITYHVCVHVCLKERVFVWSLLFSWLLLSTERKNKILSGRRQKQEIEKVFSAPKDLTEFECEIFVLYHVVFFFFPLIILSLTHTHTFIYRIWFRVVQVLEMSQSTKIMPAWLRCWP